MYESPIHVYYTDVKHQLEGEILTAIHRVGISVDKDELLRALSYDRGQYNKGYADGKAEATVHGYWVGLEYDGYADGCPVYHLWGCSNCQEEYESEGDPPTHDYCPCCGAKMDAEPPEWEELDE